MAGGSSRNEVQHWCFDAGRSLATYLYSTHKQREPARKRVNYKGIAKWIVTLLEAGPEGGERANGLVWKAPDVAVNTLNKFLPVVKYAETAKSQTIKLRK